MTWFKISVLVLANSF